jgi:hypothetical protein
MIRAAILTVSDTGFLGMRRDVSGPPPNWAGR